jgi:malate dehydrogenase (oxaloacetate-decarboxylating)(NADP+)
MSALKQKALTYHETPKPGKIEVQVSKSTETQEDLSLAYTPGVAEPVKAIAEDAEAAYRYTTKGNLVAVITDGSAVLGLGNVGALAGKPVMEGKGVLFKRFADIDVFDIEIDTQDTEAFIQTVVNIAPTFGGINLEDISAPRCFEIEERLKERLNIPVFHDDQHGTAIIVAAALKNALTLQEKHIEDVIIVCLGAGAAGVASMNLLLAMGAKQENILMLDRKGVISNAREDELPPHKKAFMVDTDKKDLLDACTDADVFIGVSGANLLSPAMLSRMASKPIVFALSNPDPEINPTEALETRSDLIMATGRSDYPNQVNNVLGFPFIFRGALDVRATIINTDMQLACVDALAELAREPVPEEVLQAYNVNEMSFGKDYIIPKPLDPRLPQRIPQAIAQAAIDSGVAGK